MVTKLNEQEVEAIKGFQQKTQNVILDLGRIEMQMMDLLDLKEKVKEVMTQVGKEQSEFFQTVESTYGKGQINLETFEHIRSEETEADGSTVVPFTEA